LRSESTAITVIVIYSVMLALSLLLSAYALFSSLEAVSRAEYMYYRQAFQAAALNIPRVASPLGGGSFSVSLPSMKMGVGWMAVGEVEVFVNATLVARMQCLGVYSRFDGAITTSRKLVYGSDRVLVDDMRLIPRLVEYYSDGGTYLVMDTCRVLYQIDRVGEAGRVAYYLRIIYINLTPRVSPSYSSELRVLHISPRASPLVKTYDNVYGLLIRIRYSSGEEYVITPNDFGLTPPFTLTMITYEVGVEVK